jgi:hypothetical protein
MGHSKRRAIRAALARLGLQARPADVVIALASWGFAVTAPCQSLPAERRASGEAAG